MSLTNEQILQRLTELVNWKNALVANSKTTIELDLMDAVDRDGILRIAVASGSRKLSIQNLVDNISEDLVLGNVPAKFQSVVVDYDAPGTTLSKVISQINSNSNYVLEQGTLYFFYTNRIVLTNGEGISVETTPTNPNPPTYAVIQEFFVLTQRVNQNAQGVVSLGVGGTTLQTNGLRYFNTIDNRSFEPIEFDLGDIGTTVVEDAVNAGGPFSTPNGVTVIFRAIQNGEEELWLYLGAEEEIGNGFDPVVDTDFRMFPNEDNVDPPPAYQESLPQKNTSQSNVIDISNHEGVYYDLSENTPDEINISMRSLFGFAKILIDTTGKTEFPKPQGTLSFTVTGTNGSANLNIGSFSYPMPFDTNEDTTVSSFVTNQAATILTETGLTVVADGDILEVNGFVLDVVEVVNVSGDVNATYDFGYLLQMAESPSFEPSKKYVMHLQTEDGFVQYWFREFGKLDYNGVSGTPVSLTQVDRQSEITSNVTISGTQKGLNNIYPINSNQDVSVTIEKGTYVVNDVINFKWLGDGVHKLLRGQNVRLEGNRNIDNIHQRKNIGNLASVIFDRLDGSVLVGAVIGDVEGGYLGKITISNYDDISVGETNLDVTIIGSGFSENTIITSNDKIQINSKTFVNSNQYTINIDVLGNVGDSVDLTYDNGDVFEDIGAIIISSVANSWNTNDLRAYYRLELNSDDSVGTLNGINNNIVFSNNEAVFNGTDSYIDLPDDDLLSYVSGNVDQDMTITFLVDFSSLNGEWLLSKMEAATIVEYRLNLVSNNELLFQTRDTASNATLTNKLNPHNFSLNTYYHVAIRKIGNNIDIFIDGSLVSSTTTTIGSYVSMQNNTSVLRIGSQSWQSGGFFNGKIKGLGLWNLGLSNSIISDVSDEQLINDNQLL